MFRPEVFDILGVGVFGFITVLSAWSLKTGHFIPQWATIALLIIGIGGLIIDSLVVYIYFFT